MSTDIIDKLFYYPGSVNKEIDSHADDAKPPE
jgi:hypothetical protein